MCVYNLIKMCLKASESNDFFITWEVHLPPSTNGPNLILNGELWEIGSSECLEEDLPRVLCWGHYFIVCSSPRPLMSSHDRTLNLIKPASTPLSHFPQLNLIISNKALPGGFFFYRKLLLHTHSLIPLWSGTGDHFGWFIDTLKTNQSAWVGQMYQKEFQSSHAITFVSLWLMAFLNKQSARVCL